MNNIKVLSGLRIPPQSIEAEMALLGSIMMKPEVLTDVLDITNKYSFYSEKNRLVYDTIIELYSKGSPIDLISVSSRLSEKGSLERIGSNMYLTEIINSVPSASNARHYAEIVRKKSIMRNLISAADDISMLGYDEAMDIEELMDKAEKSIYDVTNVSQSKSFIDLKSALGDAWERFDRLHKSKDEMRGVPTGFSELDGKLAGLQKSDLIILAARPSMGKTSLALDIARLSATKHGTPVCIFSLEMSSQQLVDRLVAAEANIDAWKLRTGTLNVEEASGKIRDSLDSLSKAPIVIDDQPGSNILRMRSIARKLKSEGRLGLIVVDYLQLMVPTSTRANDTTVQQVTEISRSLKNLARELDVPVLALSQLSRNVEQRGGRPKLSDLRDSGSIEQDADVVMFIHREDKNKEASEKTNICEILIEKHRNGPTGMIQLYFDEKKTSFHSVDNKHQGGAVSDFDDF